jgi:hypothetical protein
MFLARRMYELSPLTLSARSTYLIRHNLIASTTSAVEYASWGPHHAILSLIPVVQSYAAYDKVAKDP